MGKELRSIEPYLPNEPPYRETLPLDENSPSSEDIYRTLSSPIDVQLEITTACNNTCTHCYNYWRGENLSETTLDEESLYQVIEELRKNQVFGVNFTGGEPFLFKEITLKGIKWAREKGISPSLNTNLTTIASEDAFRLKEAGIDSVLTSLLSSNEETHDLISQRHGSFKRTLTGIKACVDAEIRVWTNMVVTQQNQRQVYETGKFVKEIGGQGFSATKAAPCLSCSDFSPLEIDRDSFKKMLEDLLLLERDLGLEVDSLTAYPLCAIGDGERLEKFARRSCVGGITALTIGANGEIRPCSHADITYGNIFQESLSEVWKNMKDWRDGSLLPKACLEECEYFGVCGAGCRMEAKYQGDIKGKDPLVTGPSDVTSLPSWEITSVPPDFLEKRVLVNPDLKTRKEEFGGIMCSRDGLPLFLNEDAYVVILKLKGLISPFTFKEAASNLGLSQDSSDFFWALFTREVFQEIR